MDLSNSQGFVASGSAVKAGAKRVEHTASKQLSRKAPIPGTIAAAEGATLVNRSQADKQISGLRKLQSWTDKPFQLEFFGGIAAWVLGGIAAAAGALKARTIIRSVLKAPVEALRKATKISELPGAYMEAVAGHARSSALTKVASAQVPAAKASINPLKWYGNVSERKKAIEEIIAKTDLATADVSHIKGATSAVRMAENTAKAAERYKVSGATFGTKMAETTSVVTAPIKNGVKSGLEGLDKTVVGSGFQKFTSKLPKWSFFEGVRGEGLSGTAKSVANAWRGMPLFGKLMWIGGAAGITAVGLAHRNDNRKAKQSLNDIAADIGTDSALYANIKNAYDSGKLRHLAGSTAMGAGEFLNSYLFASHDLPGGPKMIFAQMLIPMAGQAIIKENKALNAFENLKLADAGKAELTPENRIVLVRTLAAYTPAVAMSSGKYNPEAGYYNKLNVKVAEAIVEKNMNAHEIMKLLGDDKAFVAFAAEVDAKQKAAATAEKAAVTAEPAAETVATAHPHAIAAGAPSSKISAAVAQGKVVEHHKVASV